MAVSTPSSIILSYTYDPNVVTNDKTFFSSEGFYFALSDLLSGVKDVAANQDTLLLLTDNYNLNSKIDNYEEIDKSQIISNTTISFVSAGTTMYLSAGTNNQNIAFTQNLSTATVFSLYFTNNTVSLSTDGLFVTIYGTNDINMQTLRGDAATTQFFYYTLFNDEIVLLTKTTNEILTVNNTSNTLESVTYTSSSFTSGQKFKLNRFYYNSINNKGESNLAKYVATPNNLTIDTATTDLAYNYLITSPYVSLNSAELYSKANITPLKNYYSPNGVQTPTLSTQLKQYNKIYTGLNTQDGYDKVYLGYKGSEISKVFTKDKDTYFHFPVSATNVALSASTLVKAGALGGSSPWRSDRIFVKQADYRNYSNWGNFTGTQNGAYFCTWLSASPVSGEGVWMDRYFNPSRINLTGVLTSTSFLTASNNFPNVIWDTPSTQTFNNECLYVYHRIGDVDNQNIVDTLSSSLIHYFKTWTNPVIDKVTGLSAGVLYNFATSAVETLPGTRDESLNTDISYGVLDFNNSNFKQDGITLAFQAYNTDWSNFKGSQLVGNYYHGGIGVVKNNTLLTPVISYISSYDGAIRSYNTALETINYSPAILTNKNIVLKGEFENSYYIVTTNKKIFTYDQDGLNTGASNFTLSGDVYNAFLTKEQGLEQILVFTKPANSTIYWRKYNVDGTLSTTGTVSGSAVNVTGCTIDLYGTPIYFNSASGCGTVDSDNNVFLLSGDNLIRSANKSTSAVVLSALSAEYVSCDHENNIWLLYCNRNLCKLDNYGNILWDIHLTDATITTNYPRFINFISELNPTTGKQVFSGLIIDQKTQQMFKIRPADGAILSTTSVKAGTPFYWMDGDITGYDYQRKYVYPYSSEKNILVRLYAQNTIGNSSSVSAASLSYDPTILTPGWHHFAVTLNDTNYLKFYVDGKLVNSTLVGNASGIYKVYNIKNNPDVLVGTASFKKETLAQYTGMSTDPYRFNGRIADIRFYNQALQQADIKALQKRFLLSSFTDLTWSSPTGQRYYIEQIERFFLHRLPGAKSNMFNIKIKNSNITNLTLRSIIEKNIIASLSNVKPVHTKLKSIIWS